MPHVGRLAVLGAVAVVAVAGLSTSMVATNPLSIGPLGVTLWFVGLLAGLWSLLTLGLYGLKTFLHLHSARVARLRYAQRQGLLLASWGVGVLALSSLHQFNVRDAILLALLLGIIEVYVRLRWP